MNAFEVDQHKSDLIQVLRELISGRIAIPSFQRDYCWTHENVLDLVDSLEKGWPLGHIFLMQKTPNLKTSFKQKFTKDFSGNPELILDGAQRLETLYKLFASCEYRLFYNCLTKKYEVYFTVDEQEAAEALPYMFDISVSVATELDYRVDTSMIADEARPFVEAQWAMNDLYGKLKKDLFLYLLEQDDSIEESFKQECRDFIAGVRPPMPYSVPKKGKVAVQPPDPIEEFRDSYIEPYMKILNIPGGFRNVYIGVSRIRLDWNHPNTSLKEAIAYFKRMNMSGVPVDIEALALENYE